MKSDCFNLLNVKSKLKIAWRQVKIAKGTYRTPSRGPIYALYKSEKSKRGIERGREFI